MAYLNNTGVETLTADIKSYADNTYVSSVNSKTSTVVLDADDVGAMSEWVLLWTNASPTSEFAAQTVSLDLAEYDAVLITFYGNTSSEHTAISSLMTVGDHVNCYINTGLGSMALTLYTRSFDITTSGIDFGDCSQKAYNSTSASTTNNNDVIPYKIYGIKGVITT